MDHVTAWLVISLPSCSTILFLLLFFPICEEPMITKIEALKGITHLGAQDEGTINTARRIYKSENKSAFLFPFYYFKQAT